MDYTTIIEPVLEITLAGVAEDRPWRDLLREEGLPVFSDQGQSRLLISAVDSKYMGIRFQELSISVQVAENQYFLVHAYNSLALFALAERTFFQTPYYKGVITARPEQIALRSGAALYFEAELAAGTPAAAEQRECNELQIYLPRRLHPRSNRVHFFHARLEGETKIYRNGINFVRITPDPQHDPRYAVWELLHASGFKVLEWRVRPAARHSKSKTFKIAPEL